MKTILTTFALAATTMLAGEITPAQLLRDVPDASRYLYGVPRIPGVVKMKVNIDEKGHVGKVKILAGHPEQVAAAVRMVKDYHYAPATDGGQPVASQLEVHFNFNQSLQ